MLQYVNSVLVGKAQSTTAKTLATAVAGDILMFDAQGAVVATEDAATKAGKVKFGLVTNEVLDYVTPAGVAASVKVIKYSNYITKNSVRTYSPFTHSPIVESKIDFDFTGFTPVIGNRYVLRIIYKDIYEHPGQYTHTYEALANSTTLADLIASFGKLVNRDTRRRCTAVATATKLTLTALPKNDNEGKESINIYTQVEMDAVMYYTNPNATGFSSKNKYPLDKLAITKTPGTSGKGNAKIIRDREQAALSYKGITNRTWWPVIKPELNIDLSKKYDGFIIEFEPEHRTAEDGFRKTKQSVEVYVDNVAALSTTFIGKLTTAFISASADNGEDPTV